MSDFSKGDRVRCIQTWTTYVIERGGEYTVEDVRPDNLTDTMEALVCGQWVPFSYFEKVEPEPAVGPPFKPGDPVWIYPAEMDGKPAWAVQRRTDAPEPEDTDDVEPEPLKAGMPVLVWAKVEKPEPDSDGEILLAVPAAVDSNYTYIRPDAIVRPGAGQVPPWLEAEKVESEAIANLAEVLSREGGMHDDRYTQQVAASLYRAGVRVTEGGAS